MGSAFFFLSWVSFGFFYQVRNALMYPVRWGLLGGGGSSKVGNLIWLGKGCRLESMGVPWLGIEPGSKKKIETAEMLPQKKSAKYAKKKIFFHHNGPFPVHAAILGPFFHI